MNRIKEYEDFADSTKFMIIEEDLYNKMKICFLEFIKQSSITIICDVNTKKATGNDFIIFCKNYGIKIESEYVFPGSPELDASYTNVEIITEILKNNNSIPVAIGSGTINDITKRATFEVSRKYAVIATAASVDGYASDGAALLYRGLKQTLPCPAPVFIAADPNVLMNAPIEYTSAGYGDLIAKNPAGADWIIADFLNIDPIDQSVWPLIHNNLLQWTSNPQYLLLKEKSIFTNVFSGLTISGFTMQYMKKSRPVSGAEHLMSHVWEMEDLCFKGKHVSHGFKVSLGSLSSIALIETLLDIDIENFNIQKAVENFPSWIDRKKEIRDMFPSMTDIDNILELNKDKYVDKIQLLERLTYLKNGWEDLKSKLKNHCLSYNELKKRLQLAGCPTIPSDIGTTREHVIDTYKKAQILRNRYTILDLAFEMGILDNCCNSIIESKKYFTR